jgi:5-dehydro-2-deoxygluconokinase
MKKLTQIIEKIKKNKYLIIGRAGIDIYPDPPGTKTENANYFVSHLGGSSANIAVALSKLNGKCHLLTSLSNDALGRLAINQLNHYGVNTSLIQTVKGGARLSLAIVESRIKDHQSIIYRNNAADLKMNIKNINNVNFSEFSTLIITGTCFAAEPSRSAAFEALKLAKKNDLSIVFDLDYRPYTWDSESQVSTTYYEAAKSCDIVIGNDDEFSIIAGDYKKGINLARDLLNELPLIIIYKMGIKGSITFTEEEVIKTGIYQVKALKPTGAGDAFMGAFISSLSKNKSIKDSIVYGSASAALVVTRVGCSPAMPNNEELEYFVKNNRIEEFKEY